MMNHIEILNQIYLSLPVTAQQEALDFLLFLQQRYASDFKPSDHKPQSAATILKETGFIGSLDAEPEYSSHYKQTLKEILEKKYGYR